MSNDDPSNLIHIRREVDQKLESAINQVSTGRYQVAMMVAVGAILLVMVLSLLSSMRLEDNLKDMDRYLYLSLTEQAEMHSKIRLLEKQVDHTRETQIKRTPYFKDVSKLPVPE